MMKMRSGPSASPNRWKSTHETMGRSAQCDVPAQSGVQESSLWVEKPGPERSHVPLSALRSTPVASAPDPTVELNPIQGDARPAEDWVTTFHLAMVVLDPFTYESSWIIETAGRILTNYTGADVRPAWLVTGTPEQAQQFLGPWAEKHLTFCDPEREMVKSLGLERLPAFVHLNQLLELEGVAEGWDPAEWNGVTTNLSELMTWSRPTIPANGDPTPFTGSDAI